MQKDNDKNIEDIAELFLSLVEGCPVEDETTIEEHDKRYHHGHYDPETMTCNVRERQLSRKAEDDYYQKLSQGVTFDAAEKWLRDKGYADCCRVEKLSDLKDKFGFSNVDYSELELNGKPLPQEVFEKDVIAMMVVCRDIETRFPGFQLPFPKLFAWDQTNQENGDVFYSTSSLDKRDVTRTCYVALGDFFSGRGTVQPMYHILRHEIGHLLATWKIFQATNKIVGKFGTTEEYLSYARENISAYSGTNIEESIAEAFSIYTSPSYKQEKLPANIERLVEQMLEGKPNTRREEGTTMDESDEICERPGIEPVDGVYFVRHDTFKVKKGNGIQWYDNKRGLLTFPTYEARLRYILKIFRVADEWIDAICKAHPSKKWNESDAEIVVFNYRMTRCSLEGFLKTIATW